MNSDVRWMILNVGVMGVYSLNYSPFYGDYGGYMSYYYFRGIYLLLLI